MTWSGAYCTYYDSGRERERLRGERSFREDPIHRFDSINVQSSGRQVSSQQEIDFSLLEELQSLYSLQHRSHDSHSYWMLIMWLSHDWMLIMWLSHDYHTCSCVRFPCSSAAWRPRSPNMILMRWARAFVCRNTRQRPLNVRLHRAGEEGRYRVLARGHVTVMWQSHVHPPVTMASLSPSRLVLILTNSCCRLSAVSVFRSTNSLMGWFRLTAANSST